MEIVKICVVAVIFAVIIIFLRGFNAEISMVALVAASGILLIFAVNALGEAFSIFEKLQALSGVPESVIRLVIKITLICYIIQFSVGAIEDFGLKSLADKLGLVGKIVVLIMAVPILENLIDIIVSIAG